MKIETQERNIIEYNHSFYLDTQSVYLGSCPLIEYDKFVQNYNPEITGWQLTKDMVNMPAIIPNNKLLDTLIFGRIIYINRLLVNIYSLHQKIMAPWHMQINESNPNISPRMLGEPLDLQVKDIEIEYVLYNMRKIIELLDNVPNIEKKFAPLFMVITDYVNAKKHHKIADHAGVSSFSDFANVSVYYDVDNKCISKQDARTIKTYSSSLDSIVLGFQDFLNYVWLNQEPNYKHVLLVDKSFYDQLPDDAKGRAVSKRSYKGFSLLKSDNEGWLFFI